MHTQNSYGLKGDIVRRLKLVYKRVRDRNQYDLPTISHNHRVISGGNAADMTEVDEWFVTVVMCIVNISTYPDAPSIMSDVGAYFADRHPKPIILPVGNVTCYINVINHTSRATHYGCGIRRSGLTVAHNRYHRPADCFVYLAEQLLVHLKR